MVIFVSPAVFYIPSVQGFQFLYILINTYFLCIIIFIIVFLMGMKWF